MVWRGLRSHHPAKTPPVAFNLPEMKTVSDAVLAIGALVKAVAQDDLTDGGRRADGFRHSSRQLGRQNLRNAFENWKR
jgi:hypothetical protein